MDAPTRSLVLERAGNRCEYCGIHQDADPFFVLHVEHIVARQHGSDDQPQNLALACYHCNLHKGPNLSGIDPDSKQIVRLFHPREQTWAEHFSLNGNIIVGLSPIGRATVVLLKMNVMDRRRLR